MNGEPAAFAVFKGDEAVSPVMSQRHAIDYAEREFGVTLLDLYHGTSEYRVRGKLDERDEAARAERQAKRDASPKVVAEGDVIVFPTGERLRVSNTRGTYHGRQQVQTTTGGSFHWMSTGGMSYSGGLLSPINGDTLRPTDETAEVPAWFFHHGFATAHNGVHTTARVRVWRTTAEVPR
ncbi:hypothetical protein JRC04_04995 [Mycolicibacterium sp. S2-37]|uniref:hypothetical protein n=1 Tax=Mycolicibacterium sp. S2-37 TaxID=2810297 RepID=UPI001A94BDEB|nr:hypothetical protein [Mycolicibacterium sp. S2-37]MBO0676814.1 hypothetical protein [Mycolicibacterium sp. S2-37]